MNRSLTTFDNRDRIADMQAHLDKTDEHQWVRGNGGPILVTDMEYTHCINVIAMLIRWVNALRRAQASTAQQAEALGLITRGGLGEDTTAETFLRIKFPVFRSLERRIAAEIANDHGLRLAPARKVRVTIPKKRGRPVKNKRRR